jgi:hypothetical protein
MTNTKFKFDILENTEEGIVQVGEKEVYNLEENNFSKWLNYKPKDSEFVDKPTLSSSLVLAKDSSYSKGKSLKNELGYFQNGGGIVDKNTQQVSITSATYSNLHGTHVVKDNFYNVVQGFCARRLIESNPFIWNDEYMKPSDDILASDDYAQWSNDCIIYSLFDNKSYQSSLRQITYQGKQWDIKNEFFPFSSQGMRTLAENNQFIEMIDDLDEDDTERFVYTEIERIKLEPITFSQEALDLLECAKELITSSMPYRKLMHSQHEEYHLNAWDTGYAQLKLVWKEHCAKEFKVFDGLRKALADKLRPKVYEFGFLYK